MKRPVAATGREIDDLNNGEVAETPDAREATEIDRVATVVD